MSNPARCPSCQGPLRHGQSGGVCLPCLLQLGLPEASGTGTEGEGEGEGEAGGGDGEPVPGCPPGPGADGHPLRRFGNYELLEEVARGGMGVVFRARQTGLNRIVAVKMVLQARFAGRERELRFQSEAESAARLRHPNIVRIHEIGEHEGQPYFSMDFVGGGDLAGLLRKGVPPFARSASLTRTLAGAVESAHRQGVLHRDLKPSNILLDEAGEPVITDFGLARRLESRDHLTLTGEILGSPGYLAPEQAGGSPANLGPAVDVYGLGGILYALVTGRAPFVAETVGATLRLVLGGDPVSPRVLNPLVPLDLATIALKCLQRDPAHRYGSAADLGADLDRFLSGRPIHARPVGPWGRLVRLAARHPVAGTLAASTLLLLLVVGIGSPIAALRLRESRRVLATHAYAADMKLARLALDEGDAGKARRYLAQQPDGEGTDPRGFEWALYRELARDPALATVQAHSNAVDGLVFLPDGRTLVTCGLGDRVRFWDFPSLRPRSEFRIDGEHLTSLAVSADGRWLAIAADEPRVHLRELPAGRPAGVLPGLAAGLAFSPARPVLARTAGTRVTGMGPGTVTLHDVAAGRDLATWTNAGARACWSPRGDRIYTGTFDGRITARDPDTGAILETFEDGDFLLALAVSPDGRTLASANLGGTVRLWEPGQPRTSRRLEGHRAKVWSVAFSPDSRRVATASSDRTTRLWETASGRLLQTLSGHDSEVWTVAFSCDGRWLVSGDKDGVLRLWDAAAADADAAGEEPGAVRGLPVWSPDGRFAAFGSGQGIVTVLEAERLVRRFAIPDAEIALGFGPAGEWLAVLGSKGYARRSLPGLELLESRPVVPPPTNYLVSSASRDGRWFACEDAPGTVSVWDLRGGALRTRLALGPGEPVSQLAFSPDGESLALARDGFLPVQVHGRGLTRRILLSGHRMAVWQIAWTADGRRLATAGMDDAVKIWEADTGREIASLPDHREGAFGVAFSADDRTLAVLMGTRAIRLWNCAAWREMGDLELRRPALYLGFSGDGRTLAAWHPWAPWSHLEFWPARPGIDSKRP